VVKGLGREVSRDQEEKTHEVGLIDKLKYHQQKKRQDIVICGFHVIEGGIRSIDDSQMVQDHQDY